MGMAVVVSACGRAHPAVPNVARTPVAVAARLELVPLDLSPDGELRLLVRLRYRDLHGAPAHVPPGGQVDVWASRGAVQWQPRARYGDPAAIVRLTEAGPLTLRVTSDLPGLPHVLRARTDTRAWRLPAATARALGPHAVAIGWFPRLHTGQLRIARSDVAGVRKDIAVVRAPASTVRDTLVRPDAHYTYEIVRAHADPVEVGVDVPPELPAASVDILRGKAMWLSFDDTASWNADAMLARAQRAGIRALELRLTYGESAQITPARQPAIDRLIDGAARRGIAILAWTVPRAVSFEDLAASVAAAAYRTPSGHRLSGLAVDLERGPDFLSAGGSAQALADYARRLREAIGPNVLLVATVEDPVLEHLPDDAIPYAAIAASADVLQPMTYWRMRAAGTSVNGMRAELTASYRTVARLAGRAIPLDIGGQTVNLGNRYGAPPPAEVGASIGVAHELGALGETFFDWDGTTAAQWDAIAAAPWRWAQRVR